MKISILFFTFLSLAEELVEFADFKAYSDFAIKKSKLEFDKRSKGEFVFGKKFFRKSFVPPKYSKEDYILTRLKGYKQDSGLMYKDFEPFLLKYTDLTQEITPSPLNKIILRRKEEDSLRRILSLSESFPITDESSRYFRSKVPLLKPEEVKKVKEYFEQKRDLSHVKREKLVKDIRDTIIKRLREKQIMRKKVYLESLKRNIQKPIKRFGPYCIEELGKALSEINELRNPKSILRKILKRKEREEPSKTIEKTTTYTFDVGSSKLKLKLREEISNESRTMKLSEYNIRKLISYFYLDNYGSYLREGKKKVLLNEDGSPNISVPASILRQANKFCSSQVNRYSEKSKKKGRRQFLKSLSKLSVKEEGNCRR